jgi:alkylation response protein AidB-like acyl-CoA dehydrogenase
LTGDFRAEVRDWLAAHVPATPLPSVDTAEGFGRHRDWERELFAARLAVVSWPAEYGGRDLPLLDWLVFEEEYHAAGGPVRVGQNGLFLLAPTLFAHGTPEQRDRLLPRMARADDVWAQAWSEPEAGSDLAAIRARADRVAGGWRLTGSKTWSSRAAFADRAFGLFRSEPVDLDAERRPGAGGSGGGPPGKQSGGSSTRVSTARHAGLTYLMFDLRADGVTVRPIRQLGGGTGFAEIFLDGVFVPDADVIGTPGEGWRVAMSTASHERGLSLRSPGRFCAAAGRLAALWQRAADPADTGLRDRVADAWIGARAYQLHTLGVAQRLAAGGRLGAESSLGKVFWSELDVALHETALDLLGPQAERRDLPGEDGRWLDGYLFALAGTIYAGTNEIQRTVIAERLLGLPR